MLVVAANRSKWLIRADCLRVSEKLFPRPVNCGEGGVARKRNNIRSIAGSLTTVFGQFCFGSPRLRSSDRMTAVGLCLGTEASSTCAQKHVLRYSAVNIHILHNINVVYKK